MVGTKCRITHPMRKPIVFAPSSGDKRISHVSEHTKNLQRTLIPVHSVSAQHPSRSDRVGGRIVHLTSPSVFKARKHPTHGAHLPSTSRQKLEGVYPRLDSTNDIVTAGARLLAVGGRYPTAPILTRFPSVTSSAHGMAATVATHLFQEVWDRELYVHTPKPKVVSVEKLAAIIFRTGSNWRQHTRALNVVVAL